MALKKSITTDHGFNAPDCYFVIEALDYHKNGQNTATVMAYKDVQARDAGAAPLKQLFYKVELDVKGNQNVITQCYNAIKSLPEFQGASDV